MHKGQRHWTKSRCARYEEAIDTHGRKCKILYFRGGVVRALEEDELAKKFFLPKGSQGRKIRVVRPTCSDSIHMLVHDVEKTQRDWPVKNTRRVWGKRVNVWSCSVCQTRESATGLAEGNGFTFHLRRHRIPSVLNFYDLEARRCLTEA